jgi:hypothetical protein
MTVLKIASNQMQSTLSVLKIMNAFVEQDTTKEMAMHTVTQTNESENIVYAKHPITRELVEIDPAQRWFWTEEWQLGERQVEKDLAAGNYEDFDNMDDFFADM